MINFSTSNSILWQFTVQLSPWMGGIYERMVGLTKRSLRKGIGKARLSSEQLSTILTEVEAMVNSRPLTYVGEDITDNVLTPGHFLAINSKTCLPPVDDGGPDLGFNPNLSSAQQLLNLWTKGQRILNRLWRLWRDEHMLSLRERHQNELRQGRSLSSENPSLNAVVLIKDDLARANWRLGRVIKLHRSNDNEVRLATVRLPNNQVLRRPLSLLCPIECPGSEKPNQVDVEDSECSQATMTSDCEDAKVHSAGVPAQKKNTANPQSPKSTCS